MGVAGVLTHCRRYLSACRMCDATSQWNASWCSVQGDKTYHGYNVFSRIGTASLAFLSSRPGSWLRANVECVLAPHPNHSFQMEGDASRHNCGVCLTCSAPAFVVAFMFSCYVVVESR